MASGASLCNFFKQNEVDNLNEILLEDAKVTYFDNGYMIILAAVFAGEEKAQVAKFFCWLIAKDRNKIRNVFLKTICLYDDTNRRLSAITELCYAVTTFAVQAYNAVLSDSEIWIKFLSSDKQRCVFTQALLRFFFFFR